MALFRNALRPLLAVAFGFLTAGPAGADPKKEVPKEEKTKAPVSSGKPDAAKDRLDLPIPKETPQKGLKIPVYGLDGKLQMKFQVGVATWMDDDNIKMADLRVVTYKETGAPELDIDLPDSIFNARTKEITSNAHVIVKREDFEISGNKMTFNTETKVGALSGGVRMLIYNLDATTGGKKPLDEKTKIEFQPVKEEKK